MITKQQKKRVEKLIVALRSGKYKQVQKKLRTTEGHCCLGVACDIYKNTRKRGDVKWIADANHDFFRFFVQQSFLPDAVTKYFGFANSAGFTTKTELGGFGLHQFNDTGETFEQIAVRIERWLSEQQVK